MQKNENVDKPMANKVAQSSSSNKINQSPVHEAQDWDYIIHPHERLGSRIMVSAPPDVILNLNSKMNEAQTGLFGISCFGNFLDLNELHLQHQLIHKMLLMEVKQPKKDKMWFKISRKLIRFSIEEFCVITGVKCIGCDDLSKMKSGARFLEAKIFQSSEMHL
ncbi:Uncharacterized protein Adt_37752 [Abeliophyllum distichum]|uniref:DUF1985 domain-containing protein n=1 Tax=Abeliophyllum distichum TaxID=126358 RepID=A0ABD1Q4B6_9LAMI